MGEGQALPERERRSRAGLDKKRRAVKGQQSEHSSASLPQRDNGRTRRS